MKLLATKKAPPATLPAKAAAVASAVVAALRPAARPRPMDEFADDSRRRERVNAEAAARRSERASIVDELLAVDDDGAGFLGVRRRGWLR